MEFQVALAAVIVAALSGLGGILVAVWTTRRNELMTRETLASNERVTHDNRVEDKRADAYVELLRLIEREAMALASTMEQLEHRTEPDYGQPSPRRIDRPPPYDRASLSALVAAFASPAVRQLIGQWSEVVASFDREHGRLQFEWEQSGDPQEPLDWTSLEGLRDVIRSEAVARQAIRERVVSELDSRPSKH